LFSQSYCPYCRRAKETLAREGAKCDVVELDMREDGPAIQGALAKMTGKSLSKYQCW
jgi:glutaredoxin